MVIGMGMRFSKTCFAELHLPPGGRTAKFKMAAIRKSYIIKIFYFLSYENDQNIIFNKL